MKKLVKPKTVVTDVRDALPVIVLYVMFSLPFLFISSFNFEIT